MSKQSDIDYYLESISIFYDEKLKFLSTKDNFLRCKGCTTTKEFKEEYDIISLSCGGKDSDKDCGMKIIIKFPKYVHYEKDMELLKNELEAGLNLEKINEYMDVSESIEKDNRKRKKIEEEMKKITNEFYKINVQNKKKDIENFYRSRVEKTKRCREILKDINNFEESQKVLLRKEYVSLVKRLNEEYIDIKNLIESFQPYHMIKKPEVTLMNKLDSEKKKIIKKRKKTTDKENIDNITNITNIVKHIISCNGYKTKDQLIKLWGENEKGELNLFPLYEMVKGNLKNKEWREKEDKPIVIATLERYISGYKIFKNYLTKKECNETKKETETTFTKGDIVHWRGKNDIILSGFVKTEKLVRNMVKVVNEEGKNIYVHKDKIMKGEFEPEPQMEEEEVQESPKPEKQEKLYYFSRSKENKWLSTFNEASPFKYNGMEYPTVEHAFHAQKLSDDDPMVEDYRIALSTNVTDIISPNDAKKFGGKASFKENNFTLRSDWNSVRLKIMEEITREYYLANTEFIDKLIETGDKLLIHKGFRIDDFWGVKNGDEGENNHGKILMKLREEFKNA